jgi:hypothetical protein
LKRLFISTVAACCLLGVAAASAGPNHWLGNLDEGGSVKFTSVSKHGHTTLKKFLFDGATAECSDGTNSFANSGAPVGPMAVSGGSFHGNVSVEPDGLIKVSGKLTHHKKKAYGTIKIQGDVAGGTNCSGKNPWHAARK